MLIKKFVSGCKQRRTYGREPSFRKSAVEGVEILYLMQQGKYIRVMWGQEAADAWGKMLGCACTVFSWWRDLRLHTVVLDRADILRSLWQRLPFIVCRNLGLLNQYVVNQVQLACQTESDWEEIAGELADYVGWKEDFRRCSKNVPREWTSKARR